jgi:enoyl-CoA hydratase/carnithine racemase
MDRNKKGQTATGDLMEGFCGISRRQGLKPIIAAVNGYAFGTHPVLN